MSVPLSTHAVPPDLGSWRAQAPVSSATMSCFSTGEEQGEYFRLRVSLAKRICASCPMRRHRADHALAADERYDVWGGLTAEERARQLPCVAAPWPDEKVGEGHLASRAP